MRGVALLERDLHDPHGDVLHDGGRGGDGRGARAGAAHHDRVARHEPLGHQISRLLAHVREKRGPSDAGQEQTLLLPLHRCNQPTHPTQRKVEVRKTGTRMCGPGGRVHQMRRWSARLGGRSERGGVQGA